MKLAFNGKGHYSDFSDAYQMYVNRSRKGLCVDQKTYNKIIRSYCSLLSERLLEYGIIDLPGGIGMIAAAILKRKPQYRGKRFVGYGKMDWKKGHYDSTLKTFGIVFLPRIEERKNNFRCYGFVSNRALFKKMKKKYEDAICHWSPIVFNDEMI